MVVALILFQSHGDTKDCIKCDGKIVLKVSETLDSLKYNDVMKFICTFDSTCRNNAEFSEFSNETLFLVINSNVNLLNKVLHELGWEYISIIKKELEDPVHDEIDLQATYDTIKESVGPKDLIVAMKKAVVIAAGNIDFKIKE